MNTEHDYKYYTNLGISETNAQNFDKALEALNHSIELNPDYALTYFSKAIVFHNLNNLQAAIENYSKAIELSPEMVDAYFNRAQAELAKENINDSELKLALDDLNKAAELSPNFFNAHHYSAIVKKKLKDYAGAIESLDRALEIEPEALYTIALKKLIMQKYL